MTILTFLFYFSKKTSLDISYESTAKQTIHMKCHDLFCQEKKKFFCTSSATNFAWRFRVNTNKFSVCCRQQYIPDIYYRSHTGQEFSCLQYIISEPEIGSFFFFFFFFHNSKKIQKLNPCPSEPGYVLSLQTVYIQTANWSGSALFAIKYVNLYQQPGSSNLIGWKLEMGVPS